jgi:hypothetical protein
MDLLCPSPGRAGLPSRKVTRTLPFLCDFCWEATENWASADILPGQSIERRVSPISGPLHFSSCQRQTRTARRARDPPEDAQQPPEQVPRAGRSPRVRSRRARARVAGGPTRRDRQRDRMVVGRFVMARGSPARGSPARGVLVRKSPTGAALRKRGTARLRGAQGALRMQAPEAQLPGRQRPEAQLPEAHLTVNQRAG